MTEADTTTTAAADAGADRAADVDTAQATKPAAGGEARQSAPGATMSVHKHRREVAKLEAERDAAKAERTIQGSVPCARFPRRAYGPSLSIRSLDTLSIHSRYALEITLDMESGFESN